MTQPSNELLPNDNTRQELSLVARRAAASIYHECRLSPAEKYSDILRDCADVIDDFLTRAKPTVPDGWVLVPKEPTFAMRDAYDKENADDYISMKTFARIYKAIIAAVPKVKE